MSDETQAAATPNAPDGYPHKTYLGDGAYAQQGIYLGEVVLTTENGVSVQNRVVLGPTEISMLRRWLERIRDVNEAWMLQRELDAKLWGEITEEAGGREEADR